MVYGNSHSPVCAFGTASRGWDARIDGKCDLGDGEYWMRATGRSPVQLIWSPACIGKKGELRLVGFADPTGIKFQVSNKFKIRSPKGKPVSLTKSAGNDPVAAFLFGFIEGGISHAQ